MAIKLEKNKGIKLQKDELSLKKITLGVGWDPSKGYVEIEEETTTRGFFGLGKAKKVINKIKKPIGNIDIDSTILCYQDGKCIDECSYRNGRVLNRITGRTILYHSGDDTTGGSSSKGDDERIELFLSEVKNHADTFYLVLNIFNAHSKEQTFDMIQNAYVKVYDDSNNEIAYFNLSDDYKNKTGVIVGKVIKNDGDFEFIALGDGVDVRGIDHLRNISHKY
nr:MAG TPA: TerD-like protein [Caudoviricetes sp.]